MQMQNVLERNMSEYSFEIVQEVQDRMKNAGDLPQLMQDQHMEDLSLVNVSTTLYYKAKRWLDIVLSFLGLCVLLLPLAIIAAIVYVDDPGEIFFSQYRVGQYGKRFKLYKFRTMKKEAPKYLATIKMVDTDRYITRVGRILRLRSLDELPQLLNVLKGDMSLVGPRPLIADEYEIHAMRMDFGVYNIRPGITGLAQINGRDRITAAEKLRWDVEYLRRFGFWTDMKILIATLPKVLAQDGIEEGKNLTTQENEK